MAADIVKPMRRREWLGAGLGLALAACASAPASGPSIGRVVIVGGVFAMTVPKTPYRCPPGPYERACMVASYLKLAKPKSKLLVLDANPEIQSKKALFERAFKQHYERLIKYRPNAELKEVSGRLARLEFEDVKADMLAV